jgi:septal ring factor EnvC (AmiA/AmiB activator)
MSRYSLKFIILFSILVKLCSSGHVSAQQQLGGLNKKIQEVEKAIEEGKKQSQNLKYQADTLRNDISKAKNGRIIIAKTVQNLEIKLSTLESEINDLNGAENEKRKLLQSRRGQFTNVLMALHRISRLPPEAIVAHPAGINDLIRTAILLRSTVPKIEIQATRLRGDLTALAETRELIANRKIQLANTGQEFIKKRKILDRLISIKAKKRQLTISKQQLARSKIKTLSSEARNLRDLFLNIERDQKDQLSNNIGIPPTQKLLTKGNKKNRKVVALTKPFNLKPFALSRGSLRLPAVGRITGRYGEKIQRGTTRKGITIKTRALAQVVAPHNGKIVFAGKFRGYGKLLIIDHGEGYHTLLSGMLRIDGIMGQFVVSGEPVGVMGDRKDIAPSLYVELRRNSQPINPSPWLAKSKSS